jgi:hypothetical protein
MRQPLRASAREFASFSTKSLRTLRFRILQMSIFQNPISMLRVFHGRPDTDCHFAGPRSRYRKGSGGIEHDSRGHNDQTPSRMTSAERLSRWSIGGTRDTSARAGKGALAAACCGRLMRTHRPKPGWGPGEGFRQIPSFRGRGSPTSLQPFVCTVERGYGFGIVDQRIMTGIVILLPVRLTKPALRLPLPVVAVHSAQSRHHQNRPFVHVADYEHYRAERPVHMRNI